MSIIINNVTKKIKKNTIIENIDYEFKYNNIYGLYGKNGAGKSVLLKLIVGIYKPTNGIITIDNIDYNKKDYFPPQMKVLIENPCFINELSGYENLKLLSELQNNITEEQIIETLKIVSLYNDKDKKYHEYSLGMKQKLGIVQVFMENPKIIILDEPFNGLEEDTVENIIKFIMKIKKDRIIIISSHNKKILHEISDEILYLKDKNITKLK